MSDKAREELLEGVRAEPGEDTPRLVLADYYESVGQASRAALVRLQIERTKLPSFDPRAALNQIQQRVHIAACGAEIKAELPALDGVVWGGFERGFVSRVAFDSIEALSKHAQAARRATPFTSLLLRWPRLESRAPLPLVEGLEELTIVGPLLEPEDLEWLANSPIFSTLRALNLVETQMDAVALAYLLASPHISQLEALRLPAHNFGNAGVERLVQIQLPKLRELDLSVASQDDLGSGGRYRPTMDEEGARMLARWSGLGGLHTLDITGNQIGAEGLRVLFSSQALAGLKVLKIRGLADYDMEGDGDRPDVLAGFEGSTKGMRLEELDISECPLTETSAPRVVAAPALSDLKVLRYNYSTNPIESLLEAPWFAGLRVLSANDCPEPGKRALLAEALPHLHTLSLASVYPWSQSRDIATLITSAPPQPSLLHLCLDESNLKDKGLETLGTASNLPALAAIDLRCDDTYSEEAAESFARSPLGARLQSITFGMPGLDRAPEPEKIEVVSGEYKGALRYL